MRNFDPAFFVTVSGDRIFFGSSADNAAHCLDADSGQENWVAFTDSAVRLPPTITGGRAYFGSDDGTAYCVDAGSGVELWRFNPAPGAELIPSNHKLVSPWPIRTGILVEDKRAYFAASLFPWEKSYLCAVDADTGEPHFIAEEEDLTLQGALLSSPEKLYAPQGRAAPIVFARDSGSRIGSVPGTGGVFCILTEDEQLIAMPQNQRSADSVTKIAATPGTNSAVLSITGTEHLLVSGRIAFFHQAGKLRAIDRMKFAEAQTAISATPGEIKSLTEKLATQPAADEAAGLQAQIDGLRSALPNWQAQLAAAQLWELDHPGPVSPDLRWLPPDHRRRRDRLDHRRRQRQTTLVRARQRAGLRPGSRQWAALRQHRPRPHPRLRALRAATIAIVLMLVNTGYACKVPVFRFALERWESDDYTLLFRDAEDAPDLAGTNVVARHRPELATRYAALYPETHEPELPPFWSGDDPSSLLRSPLRERLLEKLSSGASTVWILIEGQGPHGERSRRVAPHGIPSLSREIDRDTRWGRAPRAARYRRGRLGKH